jgi:hypothetical protein
MFNPKFEFKSVLNQVIQERGESHVFYMNGIKTSESAFKDSIKAISDRFNLLLPKSLVNSTSFIELTSSIKLEEGQYNQSTNWKTAFSNFLEVLPSKLKDTIFDYLSDFDFLDTSSGSLPHQLGRTLIDVLRNELSAIDEIEAFKQFFDDSQAASESELPKLQETLSPWLVNSPADSVIFMGHSQGNFFFEDALQVMKPNGERVRVMAFGSPTNYSNAGGLNDLLTGRPGQYRGVNFKNQTDPVTYFHRYSQIVLFLWQKPSNPKFTMG